MINQLITTIVLAASSQLFAMPMQPGTEMHNEGDDGDLNPQPLPPIAEEEFG
jgi:hypothetical protein